MKEKIMKAGREEERAKLLKSLEDRAQDGPALAEVRRSEVRKRDRAAGVGRLERVAPAKKPNITPFPEVFPSFDFQQGRKDLAMAVGIGLLLNILDRNGKAGAEFAKAYAKAKPPYRASATKSEGAKRAKLDEIFKEVGAQLVQNSEAKVYRKSPGPKRAK